MEDLKIKLIKDILKKKRLLILKLFAIVFFLLLIFTLFIEPKYPVSSSIIVEEKDNSMSASSITMLMSSQSQKIQNEIEIFKSRAITDKVVKDLNLTYRIKRNKNYFINYILRVFLKKPPFEGSLIAESVPVKLRNVTSSIVVDNSNSYTISSSIGNAKCSFSKPCECFEGTLIIKKLGGISDGTTFEAKNIDIVKTRNIISEKISFIAIGDAKDSNVFQIIYTTSEPLLGVKIINEFDEKYIHKKLEWNSNDADNQKKFMGDMLNDVKKELDEKSSRLAIYQKENMTVLPDLQFTEIMKRNVEIEKDIAVLKLQQEIVNKYNQSISIEDVSALPAPVVIDDASVQMTVRSHNELISQYNALSNNFTDDHPQVEKIRSDLRLARTNLKELLNKSSENYNKSIAILKKQSEKIFSTIEDLPKNLMNIASLEREVLITEKLYAFLAQKIYEAQLTQRVEIPPIRIMDKPTHLIKKSFPSFSISIVFIFVFSIFIAFFLFFIYEITRKNISSRYEVFTKKNNLVSCRDSKYCMNFICDYLSTFINVPEIATVFDSTGKGFDLENVVLKKNDNSHLHILSIENDNSFEQNKTGIEILESTKEIKIDSRTSLYKFYFNNYSVLTFFESKIFSKKLAELKSDCNIVLIVFKNFSPDIFSSEFYSGKEHIFFMLKIAMTERSFLSAIHSMTKIFNGNVKFLIEE